MMVNADKRSRTYRVTFHDGRVTDLPGTTPCISTTDSVMFWQTSESATAVEAGRDERIGKPRVHLRWPGEAPFASAFPILTIAEVQHLRPHRLYVETAAGEDGRTVWAMVAMEEFEEEADRLRAQLKALTEKRYTLLLGTETRRFSAADAAAWLAGQGWSEGLALRSFESRRPGCGEHVAVDLTTTFRSFPAPGAVFSWMDPTCPQVSVTATVSAEVTGEKPLAWTREPMQSFVEVGPAFFFCQQHHLHGFWTPEMRVPGQKLPLGKARDTREEAEAVCQAFVDKLRASFAGRVAP